MLFVFKMSTATEREKRTERETGREKEVAISLRKEKRRISSRGRNLKYCFSKRFRSGVMQVR